MGLVHMGRVLSGLLLPDASVFWMGNVHQSETTKFVTRNIRSQFKDSPTVVFLEVCTVHRYMLLDNPALR